MKLIVSEIGVVVNCLFLVIFFVKVVIFVFIKIFVFMELGMMLMSLDLKCVIFSMKKMSVIISCNVIIVLIVFGLGLKFLRNSSMMGIVGVIYFGIMGMFRRFGNKNLSVFINI